MGPRIWTETHLLTWSARARPGSQAVGPGTGAADLATVPEDPEDESPGQEMRPASPAGSLRAWLWGEQGVAAEYLLASRSVTVGRDPSSDIVLTDRTVSRQHATLQYGDRSWWLLPAVTGNGTWVNGKLVRPGSACRSAMATACDSASIRSCGCACPAPGEPRRATDLSCPLARSAGNVAGIVAGIALADGCVYRGPSAGGGSGVAMAQLVIWPAGRGEWLNCPPDEIIWLDRIMLSAGKDTTLHRVPRCPGLRYVQYRWELFSRDTTHEVYVAPYAGGLPQHYRDVQEAARHILPVALARYETHPVRLDEGAWVVSVGKWLLPLCIDVPLDDRDQPTAPSDDLPATQDNKSQPPGAAVAAPGSPPLPDAVSRVGTYFERNGVARMAIAFYYQDFILGVVAPQAVPMIDVAIALDLNAEGAVSDVKKELQRRIWNKQGHQRELAEFLLANGLISLAGPGEGQAGGCCQ